MGTAEHRPSPSLFDESIDPIVTQRNCIQAEYRTPPNAAGAIESAFPGLMFYSRLLFVVWKASVKAKRVLLTATKISPGAATTPWRLGRNHPFLANESP